MRRIRVLLLLIIVAFSTSSYCQERDAFFLVDVSGSMRNQSINQEAKKIVYELLLGKFSLSEWNAKEWNTVNAAGDFFAHSNQAMLDNGGVFCLMPFGNMKTVYDYKITTYNNSDLNSFTDFYNGSFPNSHVQRNTYLTLAKAYTVVVAAQKNLIGKKIWLVVYSDGMGDSMPSNDFPSDLQDAWDKYGVSEASIMKKKGTLRKYAGQRHYDIEVWTMGPIPNVSPEGGKPLPSRVPVKFKITTPQNGISDKTPVEIKKNEDLKIMWTNNDGSVSMIVQTIQSGNVARIDNPKDCYTHKISLTNGSIIFHKSGEYKITLQDSKKNRDIRYVRVKGAFPFIPILLVLIVVAS